jgi:VWFA-related protein
VKRRLRRVRTVACAGVTVACCVAAAAQQPARRPTFTSTVDLVSVDVNVIDENGRPVPGLDAPDFTLTVDGRPRRIVSAQFVPVTAPGANPPAHSSGEEYTSNVAGPPGRLIAIVVDRGSIAPVRSKDVFLAASRFVERLQPTDRVALFSIPDGPSLDFTTAHDTIVSALVRLDGAAHSSTGIKYVSVAEALEFERRNSVAVDNVMRRECGAGIVSGRGASGGGDAAICQRLVQDEAAIVAAYARERARDTVNGLTGILQRLGASDTPKTVVMISEGLVIDGERFVTTGLGRLLASAHATVYAMKPEPPDSDASQARAPQNRAQERSVLETGLATVTRLGGGELFRIVANPDFSFGRLASELSGYYLLGFEPDATDRDGKQHRIAVGVSRSGVRVRSRAEFTVEPPERGNAERVIAALLRSPAVATGVPLRLTTYAFQDPESTKIRLLVAMEVDRSGAAGDMALGIALIKPDGETGATFYQPVIDAPADARGHGENVQTCFATLLVEPGAYTLKAAVVDAKGRRGSLERPVRAYMTRMSRFRATQLLIGDDEMHGVTPKTIVPTISGTITGAQLHAYMELFADSAAGFEGASVRLEIVPDGGTAVVDSAPAVLQPTGSDPRVRAAAGSMRLSLLPAGRYVARAVVSVDGRSVGDMTRPFRIPKR